MAEPCAFRQQDEKHVSAEVQNMVWSPKMDLLAIANVQGEVVLHRLSWQKVWSLAPPSEEVKVTTMAWRPDGKVLAVGYNNGKVIICDVENATPLHDLSIDMALTSMTWVSEVKPDLKDDESFTENDYYQDQSAYFLPRLPHFPKSYSSGPKGQGEDNVEDSKRLKGQSDLNILVVGTEYGQLQMYAYGVFPVGRIDLCQLGMDKTGRVLSGHLSSDLRLLSVVMESDSDNDGKKDVFTISLDTTLLASRDREIRMLALKFGQVLTLMTYVDSTIQQMCEAWEDILLEMDSKLLKFAEEKRKATGGCVSNDFLRLLMMGMPSDELQAFLLHDLTDKGLKKLGHSIETSYTNIQKLVLKHLQSVGQSIVYQLSDIRGMALWYDKFGILGLSTGPVQEAISAAGAFMLKASELQQVIDRSMKNFKAFFRWLYVVIRGLSDEPVPQELSKMTQQDLSFVAQFLKENFTEETDTESSGFKLEKVGQYLKEDDLVDPPDNSTNPWVHFLNQNPALKDTGLLYEAQPKKSLIQIQKLLHEKVDAALNKCSTIIGQSLQSVLSGYLYTADETDDDQSRFSQHSKTIGEQTYLYTAFTIDPFPCEKCHIYRQASMSDSSLEMVSLDFIERPTEDGPKSEKGLKIRDISFYDADTLSVLLEVEEDGMPILVQLPISVAESQMTKVVKATLDTKGEQIIKHPDIRTLHVNICDTDGLLMRRLENMKASIFAVSGTRKVACVLFSSRRRVRLFIMDAEDEEDDDEDDEDAEDTDADVSQVTADGTARSDEDEDKENSRESGGMDM